MQDTMNMWNMKRATEEEGFSNKLQCRTNHYLKLHGKHMEKVLQMLKVFDKNGLNSGASFGILMILGYTVNCKLALEFKKLRSLALQVV